MKLIKSWIFFGWPRYYIVRSRFARIPWVLDQLYPSDCLITFGPGGDD